MNHDEAREMLRKLRAQMSARLDQDWATINAAFDKMNPDEMKATLDRLDKLSTDMALLGVLARLGLQTMVSQKLDAFALEFEGRQPPPDAV